jgi:AcrR family transcriptional regulator
MNETKEHILKTCFSLFLRKSFKEVTMNEIVTTTGLSKGAFYHYFKSKEQLFIEVVNTFYFDNMVIDYSKLNNDSLWKFYHDYVDLVKEYMVNFKTFLNFNDPKSHINYLTMMFDALKLFPGFRDKVKEHHKHELDAWVSVVKKSRKSGEFSSPMSDTQIARFFIYTNDGVSLHHLLHGDLNIAVTEMLKLWNTFYEELKD